MKLREYCCCAIPTVNVGMYITLVEQLALGITVGAISIATPDSASESFDILKGKQILI